MGGSNVSQTTVLKFVQLLNALALTLSNPQENVIDFSVLHPANAQHPMVFTA